MVLLLRSCFPSKAEIAIALREKFCSRASGHFLLYFVTVSPAHDLQKTCSLFVNDSRAVGFNTIMAQLSVC